MAMNADTKNTSIIVGHANWLGIFFFFLLKHTYFSLTHELLSIAFTKSVDQVCDFSENVDEWIFKI